MLQYRGTKEGGLVLIRHRVATPPGSRTDEKGVIRRWAPLLRVLITVLLLWIVLRRVDLGELVALFGRGVDRWPLLMVGLALPALGLLTAACRWGLLLRPQGITARMPKLFAAHLVGSFFNQFFPSTIGGDLARSWWIASAVGTPVLHVTVVAVERVAGLVGICATASLAALLVPSIAGRVWQVWAGLGVGAVVAAAVLILGGRHARRAGRRVLSLPRLGTLREKATLVHRALAIYRRHRGRLVGAVLLSMVIQILIIVQYAMFAAALDIDVAMWELAVIIPIVTLVALIPITINGLGLRENSLAALGAFVGLSAVDAVALAWLVAAGALCYAIAGGITHAVARQRTNRTVTA